MSQGGRHRLLGIVALVLTLACDSSESPVAEADPDAAKVPPAGGASLELSWPPKGVEPAKNALLIVVDTTRDDAVRAAATPRLDAIAAAGVRVERAWAGGTWTVPSVVSLLTGRFVRHHGWDAPAARMGSYPPLPDVPRLPEVLREFGFSTVGLYANPYLSEPLGFDRGFDQWKRAGDKQMARQLGKKVAELWTEDGRHFAYVHLLGPHSPLRPSDAARERWKVDARWFEGAHGFTVGAAKRNQKVGTRDAYRAAYHAVIEDTDAVVGAVVEALGEYRKDTLIIVTSDHGELLGEHGQAGHGWWLYEPLTHVPLIVDHPHASGDLEKLPPQLSNVAVPDLITRALGLQVSWPVTLADAPLLASQRDGREAIAFDGHTKVVWDERLADFSPVAFDLDADPAEASPSQTPADLDERLRAFDARHPRPAVVDTAGQPLSPETQDQLKLLGYAE